jgi:hypothetical protein
MSSRIHDQESYNNFILSSHQSLHSLISLIRQQDDNYFNLLTVPPPASSYFSTPHPSINPRLRRTSFQQRNHYSQLGSHRSSNISYPSRPLQNNNLVFERVINGFTPRRANLEDNNQPAAIEILRATECRLFSSIYSPMNTSCPISQEEFSDNQEVIMIKHCGHLFKQESLLTWFINHSTCPYCRYDIKNYSLNTSEDNDDATERDETDEREEIQEEIDISRNILSHSDNLAEGLTQTISQLLGDNLRQQIDGSDHEFQYTIYGQRL